MTVENTDRGDDFLPSDDELENVDAKKVVVDEEKADESDDKTEKKTSEKPDDKASDKDDEKKDEEDPDKKREKYVPEARHNEMTRKYKDRIAALEENIKKLQDAGGAEKTSADAKEIEDTIEKLQDEYETALHDNDKTKTADLRRKLRAAENVLVDMKATEKALAAKNETLEQLRYETAIEKVEADYPVLNPDHDDFDKDVAAEVLEVRNGLIRTGVPIAKALSRAAQYVLGKPAEADKEVVDDRSKAAREKAADANKRQPPATDKRGLDSDRAGDATKAKSVARMTQDQFAKLDEEALATLRGDTVS